ncbi:MAG: GNAT family N-acetyltransferase [Alphaproteobacteria bacterium]
MLEIVRQRPSHGPAIERLLDLSFGPDRRLRPSYRLRDGIAPVENLGFIARDGRRVVGTLRFWPVTVGGAVPALLLGPLAVHPDDRRRGIARALIERGLDDARRLGHRIVVAVGDQHVFAPFGFFPAHAAGIAMPGLVEKARVLVVAIEDGALAGVSGVLARARAPSLADAAGAEAPLSASRSAP